MTTSENNIPSNVEGAYLREADPIAALAIDLLRSWVINNAITSDDACRHMNKLGAYFTTEGDYTSPDLLET